MKLDHYEAELRDAGKARNTITTYVQPVERFLNWLTGSYSPTRGAATPPVGPTSPTTPPAANPERRSRYDGLRVYLEQQTEPVVRLSFQQVERIIGGQLPASARRYRPWWANEKAGTHVHARSWLDAGRRTANVDLNGSTVEFIK
jgi:hypothetical protein